MLLYIPSQDVECNHTAVFLFSDTVYSVSIISQTVADVLDVDTDLKKCEAEGPCSLKAFDCCFI